MTILPSLGDPVGATSVCSKTGRHNAAQVSIAGTARDQSPNISRLRLGSGDKWNVVPAFAERNAHCWRVTVRSETIHLVVRRATH